jgi:hypothetical protein
MPQEEAEPTLPAENGIRGVSPHLEGSLSENESWTGAHEYLGIRR